MKMKTESTYALSFLVLSLSSILFLTLVYPFDSQILSSFAFLSSHVTHNNTKKSPLIGGCNYSRGRWVWDETQQHQLYDENCRFLDPGFRCRQNGRKNETFRNWRWQPDECDIPRFNASELLERNRNGRIVFAGDSVGRNQWESLLCMLTQGVSNLSKIYEVDGKPISKHKGFLVMKFQEYNMTVEYYRIPFLCSRDRPPLNSSNNVQGIIRLDEVHRDFNKWVGADLLIFNSGHWWIEGKTTNSSIYFEEGGRINMTMNVKEAFGRSLQTWKSWALHKLDPRSFVFFRSYAPVHYRNGKWKDGGACDMDTEPVNDPTKLETEPYYNIFISGAVKQVQYERPKAHFLNITYLSELRRDGHPSKYREPGTPPDAPQDCSHWCLPGVPDTWNELIYAQLLSENFGINKKFPERG